MCKHFFIEFVQLNSVHKNFIEKDKLIVQEGVNSGNVKLKLLLKGQLK